MKSRGLQPGRPDGELTPDQPAREALREILLGQLRVMQENEDGVLKGLDPKCLHDFRVAIRRSRSALGQLKKVFPAELSQRLRCEFAWLGQVTGPTRDLDVYLLNFPAYQACLPAAIRDDLAPLHDFLRRHQRQEQQRLVRQLTSRRYRELMAAWRDWLYDSTAQWGRQAELPIGPLAGKRIRKVLRRALWNGLTINDASPAGQLHELRKTGKKLRYLLEFFQSFYPAGEIRELIKSLKGLQDNLGALQDYSVQADSLQHFARQMTDEGEVPTGTLQAVERLIDHLHRQQLGSRAEFAERFATFARQRHDWLMPGN
jgi:CHAD domain-containing protein